MPMQDFIDVRVRVDGRPLREYQVEGDGDTDHRKARYIEVKVDERFEVVVRVMEGFALKWAPYLHAFVLIDDFEHYHLKTLESQALAQSRGYLVDDFVMRFAEQWGWDDEYGEWVAYEQRFGPLGIADNDNLLAHVTPKDMADMGSIRVTFYRAKEIRLDKERTQSIYASKSKDVVPERYLKGQDIKTNVKLIPSRPISPPNLAPKRYEYVPVKGSNGQKYEFVFFYRTRKALQHLGVIERSPSPPPDPVERARRAEERIARLEAELLGHRADTKVKIKPDPDGPATGKASTPYTAAPAPPNPRVVIDLTDDD